MKLSKDGWTGLAVLAASLGLFALTLELKQNPLVPIGPGFYPRIVLGITAVLAASLVIFDVRSRRGVAAAAQNLNHALVLAVFAIFGLYVGALPFLGYRLSTFLFVAALQASLGPPRSARAWLIVAASALITTLVTYVLFERYLQVLLPRGRWTEF